MTTRYLTASLLILSTLSLGVATAADPPVHPEYPLATRSPLGGPEDAAGRQARLEGANDKFDRNYGKQTPAAAQKQVRFREPGARVNAPRPTTASTAPASSANRVAGRFQPVNPPAGANRAAGTWKAVNPPAASAPATANRMAGRFQAVNPPTAANRMAGTWQPVNPPAARPAVAGAAAPVAKTAAGSTAKSAAHSASQAGRHAARQAAASRNAAKLVGTTGKGVAGAAILGGTMLVLAGASELGQPGSMPDLGASVERTVHDVATGNVKASEVAGVAKDVLIGNPLSFLAYGASEIARQEEENPGQTLRDLQNGNIHIDAGEVAALGVGIAAGAAFGGPVGILGYGAYKIFDQELRDPGKTSRDIKEMTGGAIDLEQTGKDIEKAGQDVGNFVEGLFSGNR